jgi:hypothetical protein
MPKDDTIISRPMPKRPENGLLAWQATIGYISSQYSLDAMLTLQAYPLENSQVAWAGMASWGQNQESVQGRPSLAAVLRDLWREVDSNHVIFESREAIIKRPANYGDDEWIDADTNLILGRLIHVTGTVYGPDWRLMLIYQPIENRAIRFQARLLALDDTVQIAGQGPNLRDACQALYRNAAPYYVNRSGKSMDDFE